MIHSVAFNGISMCLYEIGRPTKRLSTAYEKQMERQAYMNFHSGWEQPAWFALPGQKAEYIPTFGR